MTTRHETYGKALEQEASNNIEQKLLKTLPDLARIVMVGRPENENFRQNPDDPKEHDLNWHQFGVVTHTEKFAEFFRTEAQEYFKKWGVIEAVDHKLSDQIDGKTKNELLQISIPLHDLGKFARGFKEKNGKLKPDFKGHEAKSEDFINNNEQVHNLLKDTYKLTEKQIAYIGRCAGLHYELGKSREQAKKSELGYSIAFANSEQCQKVCGAIGDQFPDFKEEIGILFLCDSLAKTDVRVDATSDKEIEEQTERIEKIIQQKDLNPKLIAAIKQRPVNIAIARTYLESVSK